MSDYTPTDDVHALLDEAERLAEAGKYDAAASVYSRIGQNVLGASADRGTIDESRKASELSELAMEVSSNHGKSRYDAVTDWFSGLRSDFDMILHPSGEGGPADGPSDRPDGADDGGDPRYDPSLGVSVDVMNADGAEASNDDPFEPEYSVSMTAMADSEGEAREYVRQTIEGSDTVQMTGMNAREGLGAMTDIGSFDLSSYDTDRIVETLGESQRQAAGDTEYWTYTVDLPGLHTEAPWEIEEAGNYLIQAEFVDDRDEIVNGAAGFSDWFPVGDPDTGADGDARYETVSMSFDASVPEDAAAGQVWAEREVNGLWDAVLNMPSNLNKSAEPSYGLTLRGSDFDQLDDAKDDLSYIELQVGRADPSDAGPMVGSGGTVFEDTYTIAVDEATDSYWDGEEFVIHFDGFEPEDDTPLFEDGGTRVIQAHALDEDRGRIEGMTTVPDFIEVDDWTQQEAYDQAAETAKETWGTIENSYLFGGKQEKRGIREAAKERRPDIGFWGRMKNFGNELSADILGDSIYHGWLKK